MSDTYSSSSSTSSQSDFEDDYDEDNQHEVRPTDATTPKLKLKLNLPPAAATSQHGGEPASRPGEIARKRSRANGDGAVGADSGSVNHSSAAPPAGGGGLKLKLNVRPQATSDVAAPSHSDYGTPTTAKKPSIKLKLGAGLATPSSSTNTPNKTRAPKVKLKAPTLASPYPSEPSSGVSSPPVDPVTPASRKVKLSVKHKTGSHTVTTTAAHPLSSEVVAGDADVEMPSEDSAESQRDVNDNDRDRKVSTFKAERENSTPTDIAPSRTASVAPPPSAVPRYLLPDSTKPRPPTSVSPSPPDTTVKLEAADDEDPLSLQASQVDTSAAPSPQEMSTEPSGLSTPQPEGWTPGGYSQKGGRGRPYLRVKRPLKEILKRILVDLRRKDQYGLFLDPVREEDYPGYFAAIGGQDKAMDLGTMESKVDDGMYRSLDDFEADITRMLTACRKFNGQDTFPTREAEVIQALADKLLVRYRHVVKTPSPSPVRRQSTVAPTPGGNMPTPEARSVSPSVLAQARPTVPPKQTIPEAMLEYPINSDAARAVAYYATGGKRVRTKKEIRAREKWDGLWREWYPEGDRNLREAEDVAALLGDGFRSQKVEKPRVVDWNDPAMKSDTVWQPTPVLLGQTEDEPPAIPMRETSHLDWGIAQEFAKTNPRTEIAAARKSAAWRAVRRVTMGDDLANEAYLRSIDSFVRGAQSSAGQKRKRSQTGDEVDDIKPQMGQEPDDDHADDVSLTDYVQKRWRGGFIDDDMRGLVNAAGRVIIDPTSTSEVRGLVLEAQRRLPILQDLRAWSERGPGVDLACLLQTSSDFNVGTGPGPGTGAARGAWFEASLKNAGKQIVEASARRGAKLDEDDEKEKMRKLRLDLLSLVKNVPVHELRPMSVAEADKLPPAVRGLVKVLPNVR